MFKANKFIDSINNNEKLTSRNKNDNKINTYQQINTEKIHAINEKGMPNEVYIKIEK